MNFMEFRDAADATGFASGGQIGSGGWVPGQDTENTPMLHGGCGESTDALSVGCVSQNHQSVLVRIYRM